MAYKQINQLHEIIEHIAKSAGTEGYCGSDEVKIKEAALDFLRGYATAVKHSFEEVDTEIITRCKECTFLDDRGECRLHLSLCPNDDFYCRDGRPKEESEE